MGARTTLPVWCDRGASAKHPVKDELRVRLGRGGLAVSGKGILISVQANFQRWQEGIVTMLFRGDLIH